MLIVLRHAIKVSLKYKYGNKSNGRLFTVPYFSV